MVPKAAFIRSVRKSLVRFRRPFSMPRIHSMKSPRVLATTAAALLAGITANAVNFTWDTLIGDGPAITPGSGTWDTSPENLVWNDAGTNVPWTNGNTAVFAG